MKEILKEIHDQISGTLFPNDYKCPICGREIFEGRICKYCQEELIRNDGATCPVCGRKTAKNEICIECKTHAPSFIKGVSPLVYDGLTISIIKRFKTGDAYLADFLAGAIWETASALPRADGIVYVPMTKKAIRRRGYNQGKLLAKKLAALSGIPVLEGALLKVKETPPQKFLSRKERAENLAGCFKADKNMVKDKALLVIDDVTTTGATLDCACSVLKKAGAGSLYAATAASVEYKPQA